MLRAEKETTRRIAEINKLRPVLEQHAERKLDIKADLDLVTLRSQQVSLQHTAKHCNTLQHTATHYNTLQHTVT